MPDPVIPEDIRQFIWDNIDSIAELEALLLFRAKPDSGLSIEEVKNRLYISRKESEELVLHFLNKNFLKETQPGVYQYAPSSEQEKAISRVAEIYTRYLVPLTNFIHSKRKTRIQKFADAFRIRKD